MSTDRRRARARKLPTSGRATIYSVAELAGVSIATVSRVLSGTTVTSPEATEKVLKAAHELAYVPQNSAKSLAATTRSCCWSWPTCRAAPAPWPICVLGWTA